MASEQVIQIERRGEADYVTLNRPDRLNAINQQMIEGLFDYFEARRRDKEVRVIVLRGAGRGFCSGADLKAGHDDPGAIRNGRKGDWLLGDVLKAMRACPQPIIALVRGPAAGGGLIFALQSDVIVAAESAAFHAPFIKLGLSGTELGTSYRLQRTIGISRAREMMLTGRPMDAADALRTGLVSRVVPDSELDAYGDGLVADMLKAAPDALRMSKRTFDATYEAVGFHTALEIEERGQLMMIRQQGGVRMPAGLQKSAPAE